MNSIRVSMGSDSLPQSMATVNSGFFALNAVTSLEIALCLQVCKALL